MLFLPILFMYIFPLFFIAVPPIRTTPIVATILLFIGILLWLYETYLISLFMTNPKKMMKAHQNVQYNGRLVKAKILDAENKGLVDGLPYRNLYLSFTNLAGNEVTAYMDVLDSKPHENRFEVGKEIGLRLNQTGQNKFIPPFTIEGAQYGTNIPKWPLIWIGFNIIYAIAFFLITYHFQNEGYGWRFLSPFTSWLWAPIAGVFIIKFLSPLASDEDLISEDEDISTKKANQHSGELLLYGKKTIGEITKFGQSGMYVNEQPQIQFHVQFVDEYGNLLNKTFKKIVSLTDMHLLKKGKVEVLYLPRDTDVFSVKYEDAY